MSSYPRLALFQRRMAGKPGEFRLPVEFAAHEFGKFFRRVIGRNGHTERLDPLAERCRIDAVVEMLVEKRNDRRRCFWR